MGFLFDSGGGSSTSVNYPPYIEQAGEETIELARALGTKPYTPYQQPRVAPLSTGEQGAIERAQTASGAYQPTFAQARDLTTSSAGAFSGSYIPTNVTTPAFSSEAAQRYMNPYLDAALDPVLRRLGEDTTRRVQADRANAASIGAFGGARQGFLEAQREEDLLEARGDVLGRGYAEAFDRALGAFQTDEERRMRADMFNEQQQMGATALAADIYGTNRERERAAAQGLGLLAGQESTLTNEDVNRLLTTGGLERQVGQASLDVMYGDFLEQRDWDERALDYMIRALAGVPMPAKETTKGGDPSIAAQVGGLGLAAVGLGFGGF